MTTPIDAAMRERRGCQLVGKPLACHAPHASQRAVIGRNITATVSASDQVTLTGTVHEVDIADEVQEFENLFGVTLDPDALAALEGRQLLLASSVETDG